MNDPGPRCLGRLFEWTMALALLGIGIHISINPESLLNSRMSPILAIVWLPLLCAIYIATACVRIVGLFFAERMGPLGHHLRAVGALIGGANWAQFGFALISTSVELRIATSPLVWLYTALAAAEFVSTYRARADAKSSDIR